MDVNLLLRNLIVRGIILNTRPKKSAEAYAKIWWEEGSPLVVISERFVEKVKKRIDLPVSLGMRYGSMTLEASFKELREQGVDEVFLVPLYPHYAMSSYETVVVKAMEVRDAHYPEMKLTTLPAFYSNGDYISLLSKSIEEGLGNFTYDHLLFSYHGIPERQIRKSDPTNFHCQIDGQCCSTNSVAHHSCYRHQCLDTTERIKKEMGLDPGKISSSFQSRLLNDPWLRPFTDHEFKRLADAGVRKLAVVTPAFVSDCLETLEEIAMMGREQFLQAGGEDYIHIPCLNDRDDWALLMARWIGDWAENQALPAYHVQ